MHPDDLHRLHRRVPRLQSSLAESLGSREQGGGRCLPLLQPGREESIRLPRLGTGILPSRRGLYAARPDLLMTGRTLIGHESSKNQQLEDHYFGAIPTRVMEFMKDLEVEALKLGIPVKTRHNEVAPNQFELAPIFEECNLANDHNLLIMALMRKISRKHGSVSCCTRNRSKA